MAGFVAVPVSAYAAPDVVGAGDIVAHLQLENAVQTVPEELLACNLHVLVECMGDGPGVLHGEAFCDISPAVHAARALVGDGGERRAPVALGVAPAGVESLGIHQVLPVPGALEEEFIVFLVPQKFGGLCYAPVVVGIFQGLGNGFLLLVEGHVAELGVFRDAVVVGVGGGGLHRLEGTLVVKALHSLHHHVCQH